MAIRLASPLVEELDSRTLPSVALPVDHGVGHSHATLVHHGHHNGQTQGDGVQGTGSGTYSASPGNPDGGATYSLTGAAALAGGTAFTLGGSVHGVGFIAQGHATGQPVLTTPSGRSRST